MVVLTALCAVHVLGDAHTHDGRAASAPSSAAADGHGLLGSSAPPPPTPTGEGGHCPFFSFSPGSAVSGAGSSVCAQPAALRKWQGLKFGLFLHWGAYSQIGFDASWSLNWATGARRRRSAARARVHTRARAHTVQLAQRADLWSCGALWWQSVRLGTLVCARRRTAPNALMQICRSSGTCTGA